MKKFSRKFVVDSDLRQPIDRLTNAITWFFEKVQYRRWPRQRMRSDQAGSANLFDLLRLVGAFLVLFGHTYALSDRTQDDLFYRWIRFDGSGGIGVAMFFIISGYLVCGSYDREPAVVPFLMKRGLRLLPAAWVAVLVTVFVLGPLVSHLPTKAYFAESQSWSYLWNLVLRIQYPLPGVFDGNPYPSVVNGSLWTLPVEACFYLLLLALGKSGVLSGRGAVWVTMGCFVMHVKLCDVFGLSSSAWLEVLPVKETFKLATLFFAGAAMWQMDGSIPWRGDIALFLLLVLLAVTRLPAGGIAWLIVAPYLVLYVGRKRIPYLCDVGRIGDFSYGLYLYAFPMQQMLMWYFGPSLPFWQFLILSLVLSMCCAVPSWFLVERHCLALKRRFTGRSSLGPIGLAVGPSALNVL